MIIFFQLVSFDYGMEGENPIDRMRFYMKSDPTTGVRIRKDEASKLLPSSFYEQYVRLYCKSDQQSHIEAAKECFNRWCAKQDFVSSTVTDISFFIHFIHRADWVEFVFILFGVVVVFWWDFIIIVPSHTDLFLQLSSLKIVPLR